VDIVELPGPRAARRIEHQELFALERGQELADEERIAARLLDDELGEPMPFLIRDSQGVTDEGPDVVEVEVTEVDAVDARAPVVPFGELGQGAGEVMARIHLAVAKGADDEQIMRVGIGQERTQEVEAGRIGPLQILAGTR
jgi:hypothetical protein